MMRRRIQITRRRGRLALASELARLRGVERVALDFCMRCERGEIRSVSTYERFRSAIAGPDPDATRVLGTGDPDATRILGGGPAGSCARSRRR